MMQAAAASPAGNPGKVREAGQERVPIAIQRIAAIKQTTNGPEISTIRLL
jgi:hypothetical protein